MKIHNDFAYSPADELGPDTEPALYLARHGGGLRREVYISNPVSFLFNGPDEVYEYPRITRENQDKPVEHALLRDLQERNRYGTEQELEGPPPRRGPGFIRNTAQFAIPDTALAAYYEAPNVGGSSYGYDAGVRTKGEIP